MLGPNSSDFQPLSILGTWIQTIPSRIGSDRITDLAVEFLVNSHDVFRDDTYSKRCLARISKEKALKELQLVVLQSNNQPTYDVLLATKMHYAAEALLGIGTMYHAVHAFGLAELLKSGVIAKVDDEHFWNLIDNAYIDDVNEAMLSGRKSVYDNEFYLSSTYPPPISSDTMLLSPSQRASMVIMHAFVQCPRLNCMVRQAVTYPEDTEALVAAIALAESLWQLGLEEQVGPLLRASATSIPVPPVEELADIMPDSLHFDSVQNMILCTRYWMLINILSGLTETLYRYFQTESSLSFLPNPETIHQKDTAAALQLAKSHSWATSISLNLPLVPLRLHTPLQISIGPWYRTTRRLTTSPKATTNPSTTFEINRAQRMKTWLIHQCNLIHKQWNVSQISETPLLETLDATSGQNIPDWLPVRVRFASKEGEMVLEFEYGNSKRTYTDGTENPDSNTIQERKKKECRNTSEDCRLKSAEPRIKEKTMQPKKAADFIHATGRNLCSTASWWPTADTPISPPAILLDRTSNQSTFASNNGNDYPCPASSFRPQSMEQ